MQASPRFRGVRDIAAFDADPELPPIPGVTGRDMYGERAFREGFAELEPLGLTFDAYHYHHQTPQFAELARAFPETTLVLEHFGTPLGVGSYAGRRDEIFEEWKRGIAQVARCPNVFMKLGGLLLPWNGFGWEGRDRPGTSDDLVDEQGPYYLYAIEAFGPERCMFESNFPLDKMSISYHTLWNAFKKLTASFSESEKDRMFRGTAIEVYRL
jgi:predicted TIM-barrel fold metal-dependent hydrolase